MTNIPRVSIITPSYNQAQFLEQCILSVLEQDYPNLEYIIIDGGSQDGSLDIIKKYSHRLAYWVSEKDDGQSAAINEGLRHATGEIWAWMNSDDAYLPGAVGKAVEWLVAHPELDILYGDTIMMDENGQNERYHHAEDFDLSAMLTDHIVMPTGSAFLRRNVHQRLGGFDEGLHYVMDNDYWLRATQFCSFAHLSEALSYYRVYPSAKTWNMAKSEVRAREIILVYERFWSRVDLPRNLWRLRSRSLAKIYLYVADLACQRNEKGACLNYLQKSMQFGLPALRPRFVRIWMQIIFRNLFAE